MANTQNQQQVKREKAQKLLRKTNVLESFKDIGAGAGNVIKNDLLKETGKDFLKQLLGQRMAQGRNYSGEVGQGQSLEMDKIFSGQQEKEEKLQKQLSFERGLRQEEQSLIERRSQELRAQLGALMQELDSLAKATPALAQEIEIAAVQAPVNPGIYHVVFFEKIIEFVRNFKKNVESAQTWLHSANSRAQKKTFWGQYKSKHGGASVLLSQETYSQRSAG